MLACGCSYLNLTAHTPRVQPFANPQVVALEPEQVVALMRQAGFSDEGILKVGLDLRNALAIQGGAKVLLDGHTEALFVVHEGYVHVASWKRGSFMYNPATGIVQ
jgi:hypothetical protein